MKFMVSTGYTLEIAPPPEKPAGLFFSQRDLRWIKGQARLTLRRLRQSGPIM
jgi:hypothetical protein